MNKLELIKISDLKRNLTENCNRVIKDSNTASTDLYSLIVDVQQNTDPILKKLAAISDMLLDLKSITNTVKNKVNILNGSVVNNNNTVMNKTTVTLKKDSSKEVSIKNSNSSIISLLPYQLIDDKTQRSTNLVNILNFKQNTEVRFSRVGYQCSLVLGYETTSFINHVTLDFGPSTRLPNILSLSYVSDDNSFIKIPFNNVTELDLTVKLLSNNIYELNFDTIFAKQIFIEFGNTVDTSFYLESVSTSLDTFTETGELVLGPFTSESPILKASLTCTNISENISIAFSSDLSNWINIDSTNSLNLSKNNKIVSYNTINDLSFKTEKDVKTIYIKINLTTLKNTNNSVNLKTIKELNLSRSAKNITEKLYSNFRLKNTPKSYSTITNVSNGVVNKLSVENLDYLLIDNNYFFTGLVETPISINYNSNKTGALIYKNKGLKVNYENLSATTLDLVNGRIFDINIVQQSKIVKPNTEKDVVIKTKVPEGIYKVSTKDKSIKLDLTSGYTENSTTTTLIVPNEDIKITNEINEVISIIKKEELVKVVYENSEYFILSLIDILFEKPMVENCTLSIFYPKAELELNEYAIVNGELLINKLEESSAQIYKKIKNEVNYSKHVNYTNGNFLKRESNEYTLTNSTDVLESKNTIKLNNTFIKKDSLIFEELNDSSQFTYTPSLTPQLDFINIGSNEDPLYLQPDNLDETTYIEI